jgi:hypothetical protein
LILNGTVPCCQGIDLERSKIRPAETRTVRRNPLRNFTQGAENVDFIGRSFALMAQNIEIA